jgi:predicted nucleic acid-binding Zn ribbon protein
VSSDDEGSSGASAGGAAADERRPEADASDLTRALLAQARSSARTSGARRSGAKAPSRRRRTSPSAFSGAHPDERDPQPVGETVERFVDERGWAEALAVGGVEGRWSQLVGPEVAAHCVPEEFEGGRLTVRTDSTAWATQVRLLAPTLLARLNDDLGAGTVTHLLVLGPAGPSWKKGRLRVKGRGPRDTYG